MSESLGGIVLGLVAAIFIIAIGVILMTTLYPISPFMAIVGVVLLIALAVSIVIGFIKSQM